MEQNVFDTIIIGGGPGGYTAALYAARAGFSTLVLEKLSPGGQMATTDQIDNYPGFPQGVNGFELALEMQKGAQRFGAQTELAEVLRVDLRGPVKEVVTQKETYRAPPWCWPPGPAPGSWACPASGSCGAGGSLTAPPATACSTGARPWRWWGAATPPPPTCCTSPGCARRYTSSTEGTSSGPPGCTWSPSSRRRTWRSSGTAR